MKRFDYPGRPSTGHAFGRGGRALGLSAAAAICLGGFLGAQAQSPFASGRVSEILTGTSGLPLRMVEGPMWMEDPNVGVEGSSLRSGVIGDNGVTAFELPFVPGGQTVRWSIRVTLRLDSSSHRDHYRTDIVLLQGVKNHEHQVR